MDVSFDSNLNFSQSNYTSSQTTISSCFLSQEKERNLFNTCFHSDLTMCLIILSLFFSASPVNPKHDLTMIFVRTMPSSSISLYWEECELHVDVEEVSQVLLHKYSFFTEGISTAITLWRQMMCSLTSFQNTSFLWWTTLTRLHALQYEAKKTHSDEHCDAQHMSYDILLLPKYCCYTINSLWISRSYR